MRPVVPKDRFGLGLLGLGDSTADGFRGMVGEAARPWWFVGSKDAGDGAAGRVVGEAGWTVLAVENLTGGRRGENWKEEGGEGSPRRRQRRH